MNVHKELSNKVAIVTGAGSGLGRAMALSLADAGASVVLAARRADPLEETAREIRERGVEALVVPTDITSESDVDSLASSTVDMLGRIDVLVNNAGTLSTTSLLDQSAEDWDRVQNTNVRGTFLTTKAVGRHMVGQKSGKVINVASNFALKGIAMHAGYCASKAAVIAFTRSLAVEWARHNVQVNALAPGYFETELTASAREDAALLERIVKAVPARRMGRPDELAAWTRLLASPASDFMTGETIVIDGGQSVQ